jgi:hypothetical protein
MIEKRLIIQLSDRAVAAPLCPITVEIYISAIIGRDNENGGGF